MLVARARRRYALRPDPEEVASMIAVIFEVEPRDGMKDAYLEAAASLKPQLEKADGFISIERFQSLTQPGKMLSLSFWRDEDAVKAWRNVEAHRRVQDAGRRSIFSGYRLRVAAVVRDYGMDDRVQAPEDSRRAHQV
jgi:heme-degrading monooxygenase HmoA